MPIKEGNLEINMHIETILCKEEGTDYSDVHSQKQKVKKSPKVTSKPPDGRQVHGTGFPSQPLSEPTVNTLIADFQAAELRPQNCYYLNHPVCSTLLWNP
jgi:hypothetical protein